jgi:hypothetical protein
MKKRHYGVDPRIPFSSEQKRKIWENQGKRCMVCKESLDLFKADFQHKKWIKGGKTTTKNGRAVHPSCNTQNAPQEEEEDDSEVDEESE